MKVSNLATYFLWLRKIYTRQQISHQDINYGVKILICDWKANSAEKHGCVVDVNTEDILLHTYSSPVDRAHMMQKVEIAMQL